MTITSLKCKLLTAEGFYNNKAIVDEQGCYVLQNVEEDDETCLDNQRRLLRFDLKDGEGVWKDLQLIEG